MCLCLSLPWPPEKVIVELKSHNLTFRLLTIGMHAKTQWATIILASQGEVKSQSLKIFQSWILCINFCMWAHFLIKNNMCPLANPSFNFWGICCMSKLILPAIFKNNIWASLQHEFFKESWNNHKISLKEYWNFLEKIFNQWEWVHNTEQTCKNLKMGNLVPDHLFIIMIFLSKIWGCSGSINFAIFMPKTPEYWILHSLF